jgi:pyrroline-5-carboxylate reductase
MKIGFIGAGKMAEAIMASLLHAKVVEAHALSASDISAARRDAIRKRYGINMYSKNADVAVAADILFLAVKPQDLAAVLHELAGDVTANHLVVSIAAGKGLAFLEDLLPQARLVRVMPNLPCQVGEGMSVYCMGATTREADGRTVDTLLSCFGKALELPEAQFDAVTAVSGSGPAFCARLIDLMAAAGVNEGLTHDDALLLAEQTMLGTARVLMDRNLSPGELIAAVKSPGGTTAAGLEQLETPLLADIIRRAIHAAAERSRALGDRRTTSRV